MIGLAMERTTQGSTGVALTAARRQALHKWQALTMVLVAGLAIRVYLSLTNYCISGDGAAYLGMATKYASGDWRKPLGAVFSPLYPLLVAGAHLFVSDWELAGNLISALLGAGSIVSVYLLVREVFARSDLAIGAAALMAIHPDLAEYGASVHTESGYIFLATAAVWLIIKARRESGVAAALLAGVVAGIAYLYRIEGIGLVFLCGLFPVAAALVWRDRALVIALKLSLAFTITALFFVVPYVFALHEATGHWTVGREFTAAVMNGMASVVGNAADWRHRGYSPSLSPLSALAQHPGLFIEKLARDLIASVYGFFACEGPLPLFLLALGLWARGRDILTSAAETFLATIILFYFFVFAASLTGNRFMSHVIPYTFGWVMIGFETLSGQLARRATALGWRMPAAAPAALVVLILLPQTLWPIGYDMRGVRYAGESIAKLNRSRGSVAARDGRVAWYAQAPFVALPPDSSSNLCGWLASRDDIAYMLIGKRDERTFGISANSSCVRLLQRYPRYGRGYYDLFVIRRDADSITEVAPGKPVQRTSHGAKP